MTAKESGVATGVLYIVPTPIGNLGDMTFRGVRILGGVGRILAEDTRHTAVLCRHYGIATPLTSFTEHNAAQRIPWALERLGEGMDLALVSDAGTPGLSDPGHPLVRAAVAAGIRVEALPGAAAALTALCGSALPMARFCFEGFPPRKEGELGRYLQALAGEERTMVFYESPRRLPRLLELAARHLGGERPAVVARELTKIHETYHRGSLAQLAREFADRPPRGEVVVLMGGREGGAVAEEGDSTAEGEMRDRLLRALAAGEGTARAAARVARETGRPKTALYRLALELGAEAALEAGESRRREEGGDEPAA